jgi:hypothetical protein
VVSTAGHATEVPSVPVATRTASSVSMGTMASTSSVDAPEAIDRSTAAAAASFDSRGQTPLPS